MQSNNLIDNKYSFTDIVDTERLTSLFEKYSKSTGFTIGLVDNNTLEILIKIGWHSICENFHRADKKACLICKKSNEKLFSGLNEEKSVKIVECEHGLYDAATPIIIEGKHIANIVTGQVLLQKANKSRFEKQADIFGFDKIKYLEALDEVPIVSKKKMEEVMGFLADFASLIAEQGLSNVRHKQQNDEYYALNEELKTSEEEIRATNEELITTTEELEHSNKELLETQKEIKKSEEYFKALIENSADVISVIDAKGKSTYRSPSYTKVMGIEIENMLGRNVFDYILEEDKLKLNNQLANSIKGNEKIVKINFRAYHGDGSLRYLEGTGKNMLDSPYVNGIVVNYRDVTKRVLAEQRLRKQNEDYAALIEELKSSEEEIRAVNEELIATTEELESSNKELLKSNEVAEKSQQQFAALFEQAPISIQIFDKTGLTINANKAWEELWQSPLDQMIGKYNVLEDKYAEATGWLDYLRRPFKGEALELHEIEYDPKQSGHIGRKRNLKVIAFPIKIKNKVENVVLIHQDITDIKEYQKELILNKEKFENLFETSPISLWEEDFSEIFTLLDDLKKQNIDDYKDYLLNNSEFINKCSKSIKTLNVNQATIDMLKADSKEYLFKNINKILNKKSYDFFIDELVAIINNKTVISGETELVRFDNKKITVFSKIIFNKKENRVITAVTDITNRKKNEIELLLAKQKAEESDLLKTEFLNNMSHEIRTPLNGILGFSKLLNTPDLQPDKTKYYTDIIENSGKQLMQIIDDILEISRLETKQVKALKNNVCLNNLLLQLFSIFDIKAKENKTPLYLKKALNDKQSTIYTDQVKLNKILSNLLENALKFTSIGYIEIGYFLVKTHDRASLQENNIEIYIKDTGIGIDKEKQELIFDRFSQVEKEISQKVGGLGLGLSIAKENAELLGGTIRIESEKDKGTTFYVTLPYTPVFDNIDIENIKNGKTVLIVEDEEINLLFIEELLVKSEFEINTIHAKNGLEAVEICKKNKKINLVLMDLKMPIMNGFEATTQIKKICPNLPIIAQTAYSTKTEEDKAKQSGCDNFISKPINKDKFNEMINKYLT